MVTHLNTQLQSGAVSSQKYAQGIFALGQNLNRLALPGLAAAGAFGLLSGAMGGVSAQQGAISGAQARLNQLFHEARVAIADALAPALNAIIDKWQEWDNALGGNITKWAAWGVAAVTAIGSVGAAIKLLGAAFGGPLRLAGRLLRLLGRAIPALDNLGARAGQALTRGTQAAARPVAQAAARPVAQAARPAAQAARPVAQAAARPVAQAARPVAQAARPVAQAARPVAQAVRSVAPTVARVGGRVGGPVAIVLTELALQQKAIREDLKNDRSARHIVGRTVARAGAGLASTGAAIFGRDDLTEANLRKFAEVLADTGGRGWHQALQSAYGHEQYRRMAEEAIRQYAQPPQPPPAQVTQHNTFTITTDDPERLALEVQRLMDTGLVETRSQPMAASVT